MENKFGINFGKGIRVPDLYNGLPDIEGVDPEFMFDVFYRAKEVCDKKGIDPSGWELLKTAKYLSMTEFRDEFRSHDQPIHQFGLSLIEPGLEVMRYLPQIAQRLGMNTEREFKPLWEYVDPDFMMRINFGHWNKVSQILDDLPQLADKLHTMEDKPAFFLLGRITEHGLVANILGNNIQLSLRANLDEHDVPNALHFSGNLGPEVMEVTDKWILEQYMDFPRIEEYDMFTTREPHSYGTLLGSAVKQIHNTGYSYNASFYGNIFADPEKNRVVVRDWCNARYDGKTIDDIKRAKALLRERYLRELERPTDNNLHLSSYGTQPYIQAYQGFIEGYSSGKHVALLSPIGNS